ncbi:hypothetical protein TVAG_277720 [Trichomonas vaginalis G3]|uniref:Uncharacterized protein n=1 Tax=Trichomonas vaginalis (strain ATCC PRA-98 / G3) TaxID=412133 RepID=A2FF33_TRIV3|nr:spectrin binding [Trichomonas vaginalis G3]EAX96491.1 hypothetical protein TVAG_277720 [Trichomonas vaginalis G3]KAI5552100.1 spectrin binding [Trichomonas vaginalis G3]|eukprot:XP_001309421.1 hypothetical protein [Trichomonas vaginalis G3]
MVIKNNLNTMKIFHIFLISSTEGALSKFSELMLLYKDRGEVFEALGHLNTCNKEEINKIFQQIKKVLIDSNENSVNDILVLISKFAIFNNRYFRSYWELFKLIFEEYRPKYEGIHPLFYYLIYKEYGIGFEEKCGIRFSDLESQHVSLNTLEENTISKAIMDDNVQSFINFTKVDGFNENQKFKVYFIQTHMMAIHY